MKFPAALPTRHFIAVRVDRAAGLATVQRPSSAAPTATVVTTAETDPSSIAHPAAFAILTAGATVIEVKTKIKIAAAIGDEIETRTKIATKTAAVIAAVTGASIEIAIKIA